MNRIYLVSILCIITLSLQGQSDFAASENLVHSSIDSSQVENVVLIQEFQVEASLEDTWKAYTTKEGWESWAAAKASVDLKNGGIIKTTYDPTIKLGDEGTITLHVVNFVPHRMITLQAELTPHFPEFMKEDAAHMYNVVLFEEIEKQRTKITSYGIGYKLNDKYRSLLDFFVKGNEQSYMNLISYLKTGEPSVKY